MKPTSHTIRRTGFLFRDKERKNIVQDLLRGTSLISIYGEGGIGKTALAREIIDYLAKNEPDSFDIIWWHSSKLEELTIEGITRIREKVDPLSKINEEFLESTGISIKEAKEMGFKTLIILDNLETDLHEDKKSVMNFIYENDPYCQMLLTTRVRLGEAEKPYKLPKFSEHESIIFLRKLALYSNLESFFTTPDSTLKIWVKKLSYSPLYLKLFSQNIVAGKEPDQIFREQGKVVSFIFKTVYENLSPDAKVLLHTLRIANRPLDRYLLKFLLPDEWKNDDDRFNEAKISLESSCLINAETIGGSFHYSLNDQTISFMRSELIAPKNRPEIREKIKKLDAASGLYRRSRLVNDLYNFNYFPPREDSSKRILVGELMKINEETIKLRKSRKAAEREESDSNMNTSDYIEDKAKHIVRRFEDLIKQGAEYAPIHRLYGLFLAENKDLSEAINQFTKGLAIAQGKEERAQILYHFSIALQRDDKPEESLPFMPRVMEFEKSSRSAYTLSSVYADLGEIDEA